MLLIKWIYKAPTGKVDAQLVQWTKGLSTVGVYGSDSETEKS